MGLLEMVFKMAPSIIIPSVSLFIQIVCYQGLVFQELNFFFYKQLPYMKIDGTKGFFEEFDRWDVLIMLDIILFLSNLVTIVVLLIGSVYPGEFIRNHFDFNEKDPKTTKDYMEEDMDVKKFILQVNSLAIANSVYLYLIYIDVFQRDMKIQWFVLVFDWLFFFGVYSSRGCAACSFLLLVLRYLIVPVWGLVIYFKTNLILNPEYEIAYNIVSYMLIDSFIFFPYMMFKTYSITRKKE
jgi:hypothetical protein